MEEIKNDEKIINSIDKTKEEFKQKSYLMDETYWKLRDIQIAKIESLKYEKCLEKEWNRHISYPELNGEEDMYIDCYWVNEKYKEAIAELKSDITKILNKYELSNDIEMSDLDKLYWEDCHELSNDEIEILSGEIVRLIFRRKNMVDIMTHTATLERVIFERVYIQIWEYIDEIKENIMYLEKFNEEKENKILNEIINEIEKSEKNFYKKAWGLRMLLNTYDCVF